MSQANLTVDGAAPDPDADADATGVVHGGRLIEARRQFPNAPEPFLDLSTGINPIAYPVPTLPQEAYTRLPEPEQVADLERIAAEAYGCTDPAMVAAAPGTQILISLLPRVFPMRSVSVLSPTYSEHAPAWAQAGSMVQSVEDVADLRSNQGAVVCNPNNPDGRRHAPERLRRLASEVARNDGLLVVDEAFAEFADRSVSAIRQLPCPGLVVLRSFGKAYGLAGLRLGFAVADPPTAARIRDALGPWCVSGPAVHIGRAALGDAVWRTTTGQRLSDNGARLATCLDRAGFDIVGGTSLFQLACKPHAAEMFDRLGRAGILVRRFDERPDWLRFGLPDRGEHWERLERALTM